MHFCVIMYSTVQCGRQFYIVVLKNLHLSLENRFQYIGKVIILDFSALYLTMRTSFTHRLFSEKKIMCTLRALVYLRVRLCIAYIRTESKSFGAV